MLAVFVLVGVLLTPSLCTLTPPFDEGVVVRVSEELIRDIAEVIADKAVTEIKDIMLSGSATESGIKFEYWHLRFTDLSMTSTIDLTKEPGRDKLLLDGTIRGDMSAASRWRATKKTWIYTFVFDGGVKVTASGYRITSRVVLGENDEGVVGFTHDPSACTVDLGALDLNFSGSKISWLLNLFIGFFEEEIRDVLERYICVEINEKVKEGASELESAVFDRYDFINVLGHRVNINNRPTRITGGDTCAVVSAVGETDLEMSERNETKTEPFLPPTKARKDWDDYTTSPSPTGRTTEFTGTTTETREQITTTWLTTTPPTSVVHVQTLASPSPERERTRRDTVDWCSVLPGADSGVSVIVTEEVIARYAEHLHQLRMIDYTAEQGPGISEEYQVRWSGKDVGTMRIPTKDHEVLKNFQVRFRVTSTDAPRVVIDSDGVAIYSDLRARVTLVKAENSHVTKAEIHTSLKFTGTVTLALLDGVYNLVPTVVGSSEITKARFTLGGSSVLTVPEPIKLELERQLDEMLGEMLPNLIREELKTGFPLNIPESLVIHDATIQYREDYILVTADNVVVNL